MKIILSELGTMILVWGIVIIYYLSLYYFFTKPFLKYLTEKNSKQN
jgi:F0F1-type ATP synthase membrane subunit b/b'